MCEVSMSIDRGPGKGNTQVQQAGFKELPWVHCLVLGSTAAGDALPSGEPMAVQPTDAARQGEDRSCCKQNNQKPSPDANTAQGTSLSPTPAIDAGPHASGGKALSLAAIRQLAPRAVAGSPTGVSVRGLRVIRKRAGMACRRAREELGSTGLLWSKAAWDGSLHATMAGLQALAFTADVGLQQGFKEVLTLIKQAHLEGLQRLASASRGGHKTAASRAHTSP
ncbi:hypothetical protein KFL_013570020, partial [Klebsormidium nitens]